MKNIFSRRDFLRTGALAAATLAAPHGAFALPQPQEPQPADERLAGPPRPRQLHLPQLHSRAADRASCKQLNVTALNAKDVKDHLPIDPPAEAAALADYAASRHQAPRRRRRLFPERRRRRHPRQIRVLPNAPASPSSSPATPPSKLSRASKNSSREYDIRIAIHNHGPEDKLWPSPLDVLKAVKNHGPAHRLLHRRRPLPSAPAPTSSRPSTQVGPRLFNMHMKDLTNFQDKGEPGSRRRRQNARSAKSSKP